LPIAAAAVVADAPADRAAGMPPPAAPAVPPLHQPAPVAPATGGDGAGEAATDDDDPSGQSLALAVGVLMHRHAMSRQAAWRHLCKLAADHGATPLAQAERLLSAVEELARSAP
jgi:response regulator NasT